MVSLSFRGLVVSAIRGFLNGVGVYRGDVRISFVRQWQWVYWSIYFSQWGWLRAGDGGCWAQFFYFPGQGRHNLAQLRGWWRASRVFILPVSDNGRRQQRCQPPPTFGVRKRILVLPAKVVSNLIFTRVAEAATRHDALEHLYTGSVVELPMASEAAHTAKTFLSTLLHGTSPWKVAWGKVLLRLEERVWVPVFRRACRRAMLAPPVELAKSSLVP